MKDFYIIIFILISFAISNKAQKNYYWNLSDYSRSCELAYSTPDKRYIKNFVIKPYNIKNLNHYFLEFVHPWFSLSYQNIHHPFYNLNGIGLYGKKLSYHSFALCFAFHFFSEKINKTKTHASFPAIFIFYHFQKILLEIKARKEHKGINIKYHTQAIDLGLNYINSSKTFVPKNQFSYYMNYNIHRNIAIQFSHFLWNDETLMNTKIMIKKVRINCGIKTNPYLPSSYIIGTGWTI